MRVAPRRYVGHGRARIAHSPTELAIASEISGKLDHILRQQAITTITFRGIGANSMAAQGTASN
jgi:uncharacterized lipoprotein YehR (DUF1307 family)